MHLQRLIALAACVAVASVAWSQIEMRSGASRSAGTSLSDEATAGAGGGVSQHSAPYTPSRRVELPEEFKAQSASPQAESQAAKSVIQASATLDGTPKKPVNWLGGLFMALGAGLTLIITGKVLLDRFAPSAPSERITDFTVEEPETPSSPADYVQTKL